MEIDGEGIGRTFWEVELKRLNEGLPRARRSLQDLLGEDSPSYTSAAGEAIQMDKGEIQQFSRLVPLQKRGEVSLPIVILKESGMKRGTYRIQGTDEEVRAVNAALQRSAGGRYIYRPDILELTRRFPSLIAFGYTL